MDSINCGYQSTGAKWTFEHGGHCKSADYHSKYGTEDIIKMKINGYDRVLSFRCNDGEIKSFFKLEESDKDYRLAVYLNGVGDSTMILSYSVR